MRFPLERSLGYIDGLLLAQIENYTEICPKLSRTWGRFFNIILIFKLLEFSS